MCLEAYCFFNYGGSAMTKRKRRQQELLDNKVKALHELEKKLDKAVLEYNVNVFRFRDLEQELAATDDDTIDYDRIKRQMEHVNVQIYRSQERIRDLSIELQQLRQDLRKLSQLS